MLGSFLLVHPLGGVYPAVRWSARHRVAGVAAVVELRHGGEQVHQLVADAWSVARLQHPGVVRMYDVGQVPAEVAGQSDGWLQEGLVYVVREDLGASARGDPDWQDVTLWAAALLDALAHAHARGVAHLGVAPGPVLFRTRHEPVLTGWAAAYDASDGLRTVGQVLRGLMPHSGVPTEVHAWVDALTHPDPALRYETAADALWALRRAVPERAGDALTTVRFGARQHRFERSDVWVGGGHEIPTPPPVDPGATPEERGLWRALLAAPDGRGPQGVVVGSEVGGDASRAVHAVGRRALEVGAAAVWHVRHHTRGVGFGLRGMVAAHLGADPRAPNAVRRIVAGLQSRGTVDPDDLEVLTDMALRPAALGRHQAERFAALGRHLRQCAAGRPVVVAIHEAEAAHESLELVRWFLDRPDAVPMLFLIAAGRQELRAGSVAAAEVEALAARPGVRSLEASPLPRVEVPATRLVEQLTGALGAAGEGAWRALEVAAGLGPEVDTRRWEATAEACGVVADLDLVLACVARRLASTERPGRTWRFALPGLRGVLEERARSGGRWRGILVAAAESTDDPMARAELLAGTGALEHAVAAYRDMEEAAYRRGQGALGAAARAQVVALVGSRSRSAPAAEHEAEAASAAQVTARLAADLSAPERVPWLLRSAGLALDRRDRAQAAGCFAEAAGILERLDDPAAVDAHVQHLALLVHDGTGAAFDLARHVLTLARRWHRPAHELTARAALWLTALRIDDRASIRYEHRAIHELRASGAEVSVQARVWLVAGEALLSERSDEGEVRAPRIVRRR